MPKIIVNDTTNRLVAFGFCDFTPDAGHTVYEITDERLPDEPRFYKYENGVVSIDDVFKTQALADEAILSQLGATDLGMSRILEDLIDLLETKGVLTEVELPQSAKDKLNDRRNLRSQLGI